MKRTKTVALVLAASVALLAVVGIVICLCRRTWRATGAPGAAPSSVVPESLESSRASRNPQESTSDASTNGNPPAPPQKAAESFTLDAIESVFGGIQSLDDESALSLGLSVLAPLVSAPDSLQACSSRLRELRRQALLILDKGDYVVAHYRPKDMPDGLSYVERVSTINDLVSGEQTAGEHCKLHRMYARLMPSRFFYTIKQALLQGHVDLPFVDPPEEGALVRHQMLTWRISSSYPYVDVPLKLSMSLYSFPTVRSYLLGSAEWTDGAERTTIRAKCEERLAEFVQQTFALSSAPADSQQAQECVRFCFDALSSKTRHAWRQCHRLALALRELLRYKDAAELRRFTRFLATQVDPFPPDGLQSGPRALMFEGGNCYMLATLHALASIQQPHLLYLAERVVPWLRTHADAARHPEAEIYAELVRVLSAINGDDTGDCDDAASPMPLSGLRSLMDYDGSRFKDFTKSYQDPEFLLMELFFNGATTAGNVRMPFWLGGPAVQATGARLRCPHGHANAWHGMREAIMSDFVCMPFVNRCNDSVPCIKIADFNQTPDYLPPVQCEQCGERLEGYRHDSGSPVLILTLPNLQLSDRFDVPLHWTHTEMYYDPDSAGCVPMHMRYVLRSAFFYNGGSYGAAVNYGFSSDAHAGGDGGNDDASAYSGLNAGKPTWYWSRLSAITRIEHDFAQASREGCITTILFYERYDQQQ